MGLYKMSTSSLTSPVTTVYVPVPARYDDRPNPNPNPKNYRIDYAEHIGAHLVVGVVYPDCTNYEGRKIMVFANLTLAQLMNQKWIDPHFCDNPAFHSPVARFEPTDRGRKLARATAYSLTTSDE